MVGEEVSFRLAWQIFDSYISEIFGTNIFLNMQGMCRLGAPGVKQENEVDCTMDTVTIKTFDNYFSANILLTRMQHSGIPCYLADENTVTIDPILCNAIGGIKLVVPREKEAEALAMVAEIEKEYLESAVCVSCNATGVIRIPKQATGNIITAILTWLFSNYAIATEYVYKCNNCGHESSELRHNPARWN